MGENSEWYERARAVIPGGVSSPVRAFGAVGGTPLFFERGEGAHIVDAEGKRLVDFVMSWGPLILGHAHPRVIAAIEEAARKGTSFGAPCKDEVRLAELVHALHPAAEKVRFVSSGTEAVMSAVRLARGATGRSRILKFSGCYHGHSDALLVAAGSGLVTFGKPSSEGVPQEFTALTSLLPLDDEEALETFFAEHGDECALALIEPLPANNGLLVQRPAFLQKLRDLTQKHGALLLFDEVISGFRLGPGGASAHYGITPDLVTFGKIIGGGLPVGAFAGRAELMDLLAPQGPVYQAGTLSGNPVAMAAGLACLKTLLDTKAWDSLEQKGRLLEEAFAERCAPLDPPVQLVRIGSLFWLAPRGPAPRAAEALPPDLPEVYGRLFHALLEQGYYMAPSAYEVGFLSTAHSEADCLGLVDAWARFFQTS
ncbi:MAG TPA: glutamate-1-semialdehyde 2,1-aminomutase [Planctomycetes bacterium]|nr:glutamate-1-semialdehyde 2,1-aminomutase [Planctomycetota bacterium]